MISACIITRDAPAVLRAIESVAQHVDEVVLVDTGSSPDHFAVLLAFVQDPARNPEHKVRLTQFTGCNDAEGRMADFGAARRFSFEQASHPWVLWLDSDDVIRDVLALRSVVTALETKCPSGPVAALFPYEYAYHPDGRVSCRQYRERLFRGARDFLWTDPVHEVCIPVSPTAVTDDFEQPVWEHHRAEGGMPSDPGRNLRIMRAWIARTPQPSARQMYYLGQELMDSGQHAEAEDVLARYFDMSGWDDERMMAGERLVSLALGRADFDRAIAWGLRMAEVNDGWFETWFCLGTVYYSRAEFFAANNAQAKAQADFARAARHFHRGLQLPPTRTPLFIDTRKRDVVIYEMLNKALNDVGDVDGALRACETGLAADPSNPNLKHNLAIYRRHVHMRSLAGAMQSAVADGVLGPNEANAAMAALQGQAAAWKPYARPAGYPVNPSEADRPVATVTPHAQAWGIPEVFDVDGLPLRMTDRQVGTLTLALWHELVLHDELVAAESLLANAPYRVRHDPHIEAVLARTRSWTAWMDSDAGRQKVNSPADPTIENGTHLPAPLEGAQGTRYALTVGRLAPRSTVVDLGCFDGSFTNRMGLAGHRVVGVDLSTTGVAMANAKAAEFKTGAVHVVSRFEELRFEAETGEDVAAAGFDALTCADTWEHLKDPRVLVGVAERALRPGGKMIVVTPLGSWMRGAVIPWAHPWRWGQELGKTWVCDEGRAHVIAPSPQSVAACFDPARWRIVDSYAVRNPSADTPEQGWVVFEAVLEPTPEPKRSIAIACGDCWERWTPWSAACGGIGGSETAVIEMARRLAAMGHDVTVYGDTAREGEGIYRGVKYVHHDRLAFAPPVDVLVAWRNAALLTTVTARVKLLWVHDICAVNASNGVLLQADVIMGLSQWHVGFLQHHHALAKDHTAITFNGVDTARFAVPPPSRDPHRVIYSSSPDRGLDVLLALWPKIREAVPDATLGIYYGFEGYRRVNPDHANQIEQQARDLGHLGVELHGRVDQHTLASAMLGAGAWLYPTAFTETSCVTAMEAQCAGLRIVTSRLAALAETVREGMLLDGHNSSPEYREAFLSAAIAALRDDPPLDRDALMARAAATFDWSIVAQDWAAEFERLLGVPPFLRFPHYAPSRDFKRAG